MQPQPQPFIPPRHIVAASALTVNAEGHVLLVKTHKRGWEIPGGQVEIGESLIQAVIRETWEESGVNIQVGPLGIVQSNLTRGIVIMSFLAEYCTGELTPSPETSDVRWVQRDEALAMITHPAIQDRVRFLLAFDGRVTYHAYHLDPYKTISYHTI